MVECLADFDTAHCGPVHDAQLDNFGQRLATASADGHVRLWDVSQPSQPLFLADLGGHVGAVWQVAWAPPEVGVLLATAGGDGYLIIWGRMARPGEHWQVVRREHLEHHGPVRSVCWAPAEHGTLLACACEDGAVVVLSHVGAPRVAQDVVEHQWQADIVGTHKGRAVAVSWASPAVLSDKPLGIAGARLATAGDDGVRVWSCSGSSSTWTSETVEALREAAPVRDVAWRPWDGESEALASAVGELVVIWECKADAAGATQWRPVQRVAVGQEVWHLSWMEAGRTLLLSCGEEEPRGIFMKQQLSGEWDLMEASVEASK
mmetsp:Transcript_5853/g.13081  ORF Transcript_5853/g.13081 Transcript_5853/m.13081 type:complete len:319 (-) Transcript_5853:48-1004(-)